MYFEQGIVPIREDVAENAINENILTKKPRQGIMFSVIFGGKI